MRSELTATPLIASCRFTTEYPGAAFRRSPTAPTDPDPATCEICATASSIRRCASARTSALESSAAACATSDSRPASSEPTRSSDDDAEDALGLISTLSPARAAAPGPALPSRIVSALPRRLRVDWIVGFSRSAPAPLLGLIVVMDRVPHSFGGRPTPTARRRPDL
ncbi:MAG: hypothetical protein H6814_09380 [Phycisphaeraceae bacterium]|nr:hypothetical protein [Phycisphaeraceae bacterium]